MEYFHTDGGSNRPYFPHRIKVKKATNEMFTWCNEYQITGHFARWHCIFGSNESNQPYDLVQFERENVAMLFMLKFGDHLA